MNNRYRTIANMRAQGHTYKTIADALDLTPYRVRELCRDLQGWQRVENKPLPLTPSETADYHANTTVEGTPAQD